MIVYYEDEEIIRGKNISKELLEEIFNRIENFDFSGVKIVQNKEEILAEFEKKMKYLVAGYPEHEQKTWDTQQSEASKYLETKDESVAPLLNSILLGEPEGTTLEDLSLRVMNKSIMFKEASGALLAEKNKKIRDLGV